MLNLLFWAAVTLLLLLAVLVVIVFICILVWNFHGFQKCTSTAQLHGKTVIVTGATSGIGRESAREFASRGAKVILACRNIQKARIVADDIISSTGNDNVSIEHLDTSLMSSVRQFAGKILQTEKRLDVLVLNAGIAGAGHYQKTREGLEITMATNHFGHFLLANLLLGLLKRSSPARIISVSSQAHDRLSNIDPDDLNIKEANFGTFYSYRLSKLCNILFVRYLGPKLKSKGVTVNSLCPGFVQTDIFIKSEHFFVYGLVPLFTSFTARTVQQGMQTLIYLAVARESSKITGEFFVDCKVRKSSAVTYDATIIRKVWEKSAELVGLTASERALSKES